MKFQTLGDTASALGGKDPIQIMRRWLLFAQKRSGLKDPWGMALSTCNSPDSGAAAAAGLRAAGLRFAGLRFPPPAWRF